MDDQEPAFPGEDRWGAMRTGMSLLQFATIEIMKGLVSNPAIVGSIGKPVASHEVLDSLIAEYAVRLANHTLKAMESRKDAT